jgi:orc1/cdc6 family replication initiation protein
MENCGIIDESVFDEGFIPENLIGREEHVKEIARCLNPAKTGRTITNIFIHGPPGVGKTLVCRWILKEHLPNSHAYVNCWSKPTIHKVIEEILLQIGSFVHGGESTSTLIKRFEKSGKKVIVCLDESDHLKDHDILYTLARNSCGIILISNSSSSLANIDSRIASRLVLNEIEFKSYSREEILSILNERISYGLKDGVVDPSLLPIIAGMCNGDARIGLQILRIAARDTEANGNPRITIEDIKRASKHVRKRSLPYLIQKLSDHQRMIYEILKRNGSMKSGKLYAEYRKSVKEPVVDRAYRNHMEKMEELGLVRSVGSGRWKKYEIVG